METIENRFGIKLIGDSHDAEAWVAESALDEQSNAAFLRLIRRFPTLRYQRWREIRSNFGPAWLRSLRMALDGVNAAGPLWTRFDQEDPFYDIHEQPAEEIWYHSFLSYSPTSEYAAVYCGEQQLIFVGHWQEENYFLAIKNDDNDRCVYALHYDRIQPNDGTQASDTGDAPVGKIDMDDLEIAFESYADMFGHIAALKMGDTIHHFGGGITV